MKGNGLFVCYTLGTTVDILRQIVLMIAGVSVNINLNSVKVVINWMFCGTFFYGAAKNCPEHVRCTRKYLHSGRYDSGTAVQQGLGGRAPARAIRNTKIQRMRACARAQKYKNTIFSYALKYLFCILPNIFLLGILRTLSYL
jgi:hypothetical protein